MKLLSHAVCGVAGPQGILGACFPGMGVPQPWHLDPQLSGARVSALEPVLVGDLPWHVPVVAHSGAPQEHRAQMPHFTRACA